MIGSLRARMTPTDLITRKREAELWRFALRVKAEAMAKQAGERK